MQVGEDGPPSLLPEVDAPAAGHEPGPSTSNAAVNLSHYTVSGAMRSEEISLLRKIEQSYSSMCSSRQASELASRQTPVASAQPGLVLPLEHANYESINLLHRLAASALYEFANEVFVEAADCTEEEKWEMVRIAHFCLILCEACQRSEQFYRDDPNILVVSPMRYFREEEMAAFFEDGPRSDHRMPAADVMRGQIRSHLRLVRPLMRVTAPDKTEFAALVGLIFWSNNSVGGLSEKAQTAAEKARGRIFHELHVYYKNNLCLADYAGRIGRVMFLLSTAQESISRVVDEFEIFKLLDVANDETFIYQFVKLKL